MVSEWNVTEEERSVGCGLHGHNATIVRVSAIMPCTPGIRCFTYLSSAGLSRSGHGVKSGEHNTAACHYGETCRPRHVVVGSSHRTGNAVMGAAHDYLSPADAAPAAPALESVV